MGLRRYASKRDFSRTPEPQGGARPRRGGRSFVVQKHAASRLHYDLRLELDGVLLSWAVPKGPSVNPKDRRLAVRVEDHPLEYGAFEGTIPKGQYGGGTVMLWDRGQWTPMDRDPRGALRKGKMSFTLEGERLRGGWTLTRIAGDEEAKNWLLIKHDDEAASDGAPEWGGEGDVSVQSGRVMAEIAAGADGAPRARSGRRSGASALRRFSPQLCTLVERPPPGDAWLHEAKYDGYRLLAALDGGDVRLITRTGLDWTAKFPAIEAAMRKLAVKRAVLDGEAAVVDDAGRTSFQGLQKALKAGEVDRMLFLVFDALQIDDKDLTHRPLLERKLALARLVGRGEGVMRYSEHVLGDGERVYRGACARGMEGIVSKRADAVYTPGRSRTWVKVKCTRRQEFVVVGWTAPSGSRQGFGALLLGAHDDAGRLVYVGKVGTGFDGRTLSDIAARLKRSAIDRAPLTNQLSAAERRGARWVEPRLVAEVEFTEWTGDGRLRHPSFQGLREDKPAADVRLEGAPSSLEQPAKKRSPRRRRGGDKDGPVQVAGVTLTNATRVLYPEQGLTKHDLAAYYEAAAGRMLPFIADRPLSTVRCPRGRAGKCFFQKHVGESFGGAVLGVELEEKGGPATYIGVESVAGLVTLVQFGVLEIHPWGSRAGDLERPDTMTFDLDPGEDVEFARVREAALRVREILDGAGLEGFVKTSGGKGLHVVAPLKPGAGWDEVKSFARAVAEKMASEAPSRYLSKMTKAARTGRVFVDYLRNGRGATSVAPYSTRARPGAPVSAPVQWDDLPEVKGGAQFTVWDAPALLRGRDPWAGYARARRRLTVRAFKSLGL
ncbi:MAG: DNA ligase D [Phycisphaerales bacterium]|nr:DNA ligase D [Phycisphaerales bacterium]